jgi:hypothetical protein
MDRDHDETSTHGALDKQAGEKGTVWSVGKKTARAAGPPSDKSSRIWLIQSWRLWRPGGQILFFNTLLGGRFAPRFSVMVRKRAAERGRARRGRRRESEVGGTGDSRIPGPPNHLLLHIRGLCVLSSSALLSIPAGHATQRSAHEHPAFRWKRGTSVRHRGLRCRDVVVGRLRCKLLRARAVVRRRRLTV